MGEAGEGKSDCVKVAVRMRPLSTKELNNNESSIVELEECLGDGTGSVIISDPETKEKPATFAFDIVFGTQTEQHAVFDTVGKPALESTMTGYNGTIFAYGQTGSGKSWCMMGGGGDLRGIIPRVNEQLFVKIDEEMAAISTRRFLVMCSFFEIYNEIIFDLLNPCQDRSKLGAGLQVKEHPVLGIYVKDLQEIVVSDADKLGKLMDSGTKNRAVSSTLMNSVSSRSHSIFTIKVHQKDDEDKSRNVFAKLNLVDLAGSERQKGTGATGQTLKEGANINKSLSALGNVINALVENANGKKVFVPFRNSKLTRVLQESLGGNSLCTMLATLSPAACNYEETLSTLRYANRAKAIKVSATKNEEASQISRLNAEIEELKKKLAEGGGMGGGGGLMAEEERQEMRAKFQAQLSDMQKMVSSTWEEKAKLSKEQEAQMGKAMEEHKRQQRAMQEECRKRFRLLQDQGDLELTLRGLLDIVLALPEPEASAREPGAKEVNVTEQSPGGRLRSGELPRQWLKAVASTAELTDALKEQHTMVLLFRGAFTEDLKLWVEGAEAHDAGMARTGGRRACTKLETLRKECDKLASLEEECREKAREFAVQIAEANKAWIDTGREALLSQVRAEGVAAGSPQDGVMSVHELTIEDVGRILQLAVQQAEARASEFSCLAALEVGSTAGLVVRGASLVPGGAAVGPDADLLRSIAARSEEDEAASAASAAAAARKAGAGGAAPGGTPAARPPREDRPLSEWTHEDADDTVDGTETVLTKLVPLDSLNKKRSAQELLARPPPKFVHDVALLVRQATGFPQGLSDDWPEPREGKIDILQHIADAVSASLGITGLQFDPADVLKGKEVQHTLKLLQLLTIAAAREREGTHGSVVASASKVHLDHRSSGLTRPGDLRSVLEAIASCLHRAMDLQQATHRETGDGHSSPTRELESNFRILQERLQEEAQHRSQLETRLEELHKQVEQSRAALMEKTAQLEEVRSAAVNVSERKRELRRQAEELRARLLQRAQEVKGNPEVAKRRAQLEQFSARFNTAGKVKEQLMGEVKRLQQQHMETETTKEKMEKEVQRMKLRAAEDLEGPPQSEELLVLQAEKQKWDVRVAALETRLRAINEADDEERRRETELLEERKAQTSKHDDLQMQLQVILEERDGLREGMDLLWQEKTRVEEDLADISAGYTNLSDRLAEKQEENRELDEQLQQYESILSMLQANYEKARNSPAVVAGMTAPTTATVAPPSPLPASPLPSSQRQQQNHQPQPAPPHQPKQAPAPPPEKPRARPEAPSAPAPPPKPAQARPPPPSATSRPAPPTDLDKEDGGSSHYSEEAFEDPEED